MQEYAGRSIGIFLKAAALALLATGLAQAQLQEIAVGKDPAVEQAYGYLRAGQYEEGLALLRPLAEQGKAAAQAALGVAYWNGSGVVRDHAEAVMWFRKAAEQGLGWGQYYLGAAYLSGLGAPKDEVQAALWWRKAAEQGYVEAQNDLGALYASGRGVSQDYTRAVFWFARAAQHGDESSEKNLKAALGKLSALRLSAATEVREKPDAMSAVIRTAAAREQYYELSHSGSWVEVYLKAGHTLGYVSAELLERR